MRKLSDMELVAKLKAQDTEAWEYIYLTAVVPVAKIRSNVLRDRGLRPLDLYAELYHTMIAKNKICLFKGRDDTNEIDARDGIDNADNEMREACKSNRSLIAYMRTNVYYSISEYCRKNPHPVSGEEEDGADDGPIAPVSENYNDELSNTQKCFAQLWKSNPKYAYVLLLRAKNELSSKEIMKILNISSDIYVNKIHERAVEKIREIRTELFPGGFL